MFQESRQVLRRTRPGQHRRVIAPQRPRAGQLADKSRPVLQPARIKPRSGRGLVEDPEKRRLFRQFVNTEETEPTIEFVEQREQHRPTDWTTSFIPVSELTLRNGNDRVAYRDVLYLTSYRDQRGEVVVRRSDYIKDVFQPGTVTRLEVNDGFVSEAFATATIEVIGAEALLPIR